MIDRRSFLRGLGLGTAAIGFCPVELLKAAGTVPAKITVGEGQQFETLAEAVRSLYPVPYDIMLDKPVWIEFAGPHEEEGPIFLPPRVCLDGGVYHYRDGTWSSRA